MLTFKFCDSARRTVRVGAALAVAGLLSLSPAAAAEEVLARVDGTEITKADVDLASEMFAEQLAPVPEDQRERVVLDALVDMHLVAQAARKAGLADSADHKARAAFLENQALRTAYIQANVQDAVTEDDLKARYDRDIAGYTPPEEVNAAHILVETEDQAKSILADLAAGTDFATLAREQSTDPGSKDNGGDLGFFTKGQMVPEFEAEAFSLPVGEVSKAPVKSQFGFHIVKVLEKRTQPVPTFDEVRDQILPIVQKERFDKMMADLTAAAAIERLTAPAAEEAPEAADGEAADDGEAGEDGATDAEEAPAPAQ